MGNYCYFRFYDPAENFVREVIATLKLRDTPLSKIERMTENPRLVDQTDLRRNLKSEFMDIDPSTNMFFSIHEYIFNNIIGRFSFINYDQLLPLILPYLDKPSSFTINALIESFLVNEDIDKIRNKFVNYIVFHCHTVTLLVLQQYSTDKTEMSSHLEKLSNLLNYSSVKETALELFNSIKIEKNPNFINLRKNLSRMNFLVNFNELRDKVYDKCLEKTIKGK